MSFSEGIMEIDGLSFGRIPDNIHKWLKLPPETFPFINSRAFQRLRDIKQLTPGAAYVFPGATHTRFEHSLGTGHLANHMILSLKACQGGELEITDKEVVNVSLAGLLHDIGHAASSHAFESGVIRVLE